MYFLCCRMTYGRRNRLWNAYILFYEMIDDRDEENIANRVHELSMSKL